MVVTDGMNILSGFLAAKSLRCPWTSFAGKHMVSEVTPASPLSYIFLVLLPEKHMSNPKVLKNVVQNGMLSQKESTLGSPMVIPRFFMFSAFGSSLR